MLLAIPFGLAIGLVVGAVGGGGAILALPVLVYVLDEPVGPASTASLIVVAVAAAVGAAALARDGHVCWRQALAFAPAAAVGSLVGTLAGTEVDGSVLLVAFVPVMLVAAAAMWRRADASPAGEGRRCGIPLAWRTLLGGLGVGLLTGFFGVGGGFLIVPVLTLWLGLGLRSAVATSLVIVAVTGVAGLASHLAAGAAPDVGLTVALGLSTAAGALAGALVGRRLPQVVLGRAFAVVIVAVSAFLLVDVLAFGGPPSG